MKEKAMNIRIFQNYPSVDEKKLDQLLQREIEINSVKIIVLDDDPTGVQTVHDVSVYTDWSKESIREGMMEKNNLFYILTNSRGLTKDQTIHVHQTIGKNIAELSKAMEIPCLVISRSDSTLRGHYPTETQILKDTLEAEGYPEIDGEIICPFFQEGGRFTIDDVHYILDGQQLIPVGETEFAKDQTFGYHSSNLKEYVEEKTDGIYPKDQVISISLNSLRNIDLNTITEQLINVTNFNKIIVNAFEYCDLKVFCIALYRAMKRGKLFMFRTAASFVKVMGGVSDIPLLTKNQLLHKKSNTGGIVVVGSHTKKTTAQLKELLTLECVVGIPFHSHLVSAGDHIFSREIQRVIHESEDVMRQGKTAVCYTDRKLLTVKNETKEESLIRSVKISDGVQALVGKLSITPSFVIAKGGITSSDVGTKALKVRRADVLGQIKPGVPVWRTGKESRFPQIPYIIFPGNVGGTETLKEVVEILL